MRHAVTCSSSRDDLIDGNPAPLIGSAAILLDWLAQRRRCPKLERAARMIEEAIAAAAASPETRTADLGGGKLGTAAFTDQLVTSFRKMSPACS